MFLLEFNWDWAVFHTHALVSLLLPFRSFFRNET
jgi:hypothetical protein